MNNIKTFESFKQDNPIFKEIVEVAKGISQIDLEIKEKYFHQLKDGKYVGRVDFYDYGDEDDNPFYSDEDGYRQYQRVIEVNYAYYMDFEDGRGEVLDYDNIRLVVVNDNGTFDKDELIKYLRENIEERSY